MGGTNERCRYLVELPTIRYFYAGFTSHIFFGVAGYLTGLRLLQMMDDLNPFSQAKVRALMYASNFCRAFPLYLSVLIIALMTATWIYLGLYEYNRPYLMDHGKCFPGDWNEKKAPPISDILPTAKVPANGNVRPHKIHLREDGLPLARPASLVHPF